MRISKGQLLVVVKAALDASPKRTFSTPAGDVVLTDEGRDELLRWVRGSTTPQRLVTRSTIVLLASAGWTDSRIASELGVTRRTVALWRSRFLEQGSRGLLVDAPGRGRKRGRNRQIVERVLEMTAKPPVEGGRWTVRSLARAVGVSHATVQRVWKESSSAQ